ncbi:myocilin-like isoform X1 [Nerophis lumbriciformis]|uniref:myocilin-like isoform X1 n=1 Tax=Nerophis lumbriciformis TaxID=546530 RepID=UPI003BAC10B0
MLLQAALLGLSFLTLVSQLQAEDQASLRRANDAAGRCQYTFTVTSPEESGCSGRAETEGVLSRLTLLEALVSRLIARREMGADVEVGFQEGFSQLTGERNQLRQDKDRLKRQVQDLQARVRELSQETDGLRQSCKKTNTSADLRSHQGLSGDRGHGFSNGAYQEMKAEVTEVPASRLLPGGNVSGKLTPSDTSNPKYHVAKMCLPSGCGEVLSVGDPVLHRKADGITGKYGVWLQDPEPRGTQYTNKTVWRIDTVGKDVRQLFAYEDMDQFSHGFPMKVFVLPEPVESTGATMYRGSLYYQRKRSRTLIRYDVASESLASRRELPHAGFHGQYPYSWGGYTDIDLAVDERALWAIYSTSKAKGSIVLSQLDPESLEVKKSWETNIRKNAAANAFMACGRLYTVASYTAANTTLNHVYDTATRASRAISVALKNQYGYNSMVDYNHQQRKLFAWDNFHMVTYHLRLGN